MTWGFVETSAESDCAAQLPGPNVTDWGDTGCK